MELTFEFWYLFPAAILIFSIAMTSMGGKQRGPRLQKVLSADMMKVRGAVYLSFLEDSCYLN